MISNVKGEFTSVKARCNSTRRSWLIPSWKPRLMPPPSTREKHSGRASEERRLLRRGKFPTLSFRSTSVSKKNEHEFAVAGELTIHGVTRPTTFLVEGPAAPTKDSLGQHPDRAFRHHANQSQKTSALTWNAVLETGGFVVGEEVTINASTSSSSRPN